MGPDFKKDVVATLAKRAGNWCANPDCRALTSGPCEDPKKAINIGEAAHIFGAKIGSARYRSVMTDASRREITNGIWLCRNCHKIVDNDPDRFHAAVLFEWKELHDSYVITKIGTRQDNIELQLQNKQLQHFADDSPRARRIVRDRPSHWEYSLTAELIDSYLTGPIRKWQDLQNGLYIGSFIAIDDQFIIDWLRGKLKECSKMSQGLAELYTVELRKAWGQDGRGGDPKGDPLEIQHVCKLIQSMCINMVRWEEELQFAYVSNKFTDLLASHHGFLGNQLEKLNELPRALNEVVEWVEANPGVDKVFHHTAVLEIPENLMDRLRAAVDRITQAQE